VSAEVERLRAQHADAVPEKSAADSKCRKLAEKVAALEGERTDLRRQLVEERREANQAIAKVQAAQAEAKLALVDGSLASQRAEEWEVRFNALQARMERVESSTRSEVERTRKQLVDSYHELGMNDDGNDLRFLEWLQEELLALPTIMEGFMSFASLVTCEGAMNALSREGCSHYEVFDRSDEDFGREIFKVEDPVVKDSAGALFDWMWGPYSREVVRERSDRARDQVKYVFCIVSLNVGIHGLAESVCYVVDGACRGCGGLRTPEQRAARSGGQPGGGRG
jgi:hypothetical protein